MSTTNTKSSEHILNYSSFQIKAINVFTREFQETILILTEEMPRDYLIGRHDSCDLVLNGAEVSRIHGRICFQAGQCFYTDLGSVSGSQINEHQLNINQLYPWQQGSLLCVGSFVLMFTSVENNST